MHLCDLGSNPAMVDYVDVLSFVYLDCVRFPQDISPRFSFHLKKHSFSLSCFCRFPLAESDIAGGSSITSSAESEIPLQEIHNISLSGIFGSSQARGPLIRISLL